MSRCSTQRGEVAPRHQTSWVDFHVRQSRTWDCGLACVEMVLRSIGLDASGEELRAQASTESIWSVDLAFLLARHGLSPVLFTSFQGCNPAFENEAFYAERLRDDKLRVEHLFRQALTSEAPRIVVSKLTRAELVTELSREGTVAIVLVDKQLLNREGTQGSVLGVAAEALGRIFSRLTLWPGPSFVGHYVLTVGLSEASDAFLILDPAQNASLVNVPLPLFDHCRQAFGTDDDCILITDSRLPKQA